MHNLLDDTPWITCTTADGQPVELTLTDTLANAENLGMVTAENPMQTAAIMRLLCAAVLTADAVTNDTINPDRVIDRLQTYRSRFDLCDSDTPFMQTQIDDCEPGNVAILDPMRASGGDHTLWDHRCHDDPVVISPAQAGRQLVANHAAAPGGMQKGPFRPKSTSGDRSGPKGTITRNAVAYVIGQTLAYTIAAACAGVTADAVGTPWWEKPYRATVKETRTPDGVCDWLTWTPRRIQLAVDGAGNYDGCIIQPGHVLPEKFDVFDYDPHIVRRYRSQTRYEAAGSRWLTPALAADMFTSTPGLDAVVAGTAATAWADAHPGESARILLLGRRADLGKIYGDFAYWVDTGQPAPVPQSRRAPSHTTHREDEHVDQPTLF